MKKPKTVKVCYHCREPRYHLEGCVFRRAREKAARVVLLRERTVEVEGSLSDFDGEAP